ncbi:MAG: calcium-binding protein [Nostoc sp.]|uniref:calcium-binding protein n=1 Tax=Nostoc sp. TaxID=1180 RepID=UPI002FF77682
MATYRGTSGNDYYNYMGSEDLFAYGYSGNDIIYGNTKNDTVLGNTGNDYLNGWSGDDVLAGESGSDTLVGSSGNDKLYGSNSTAYNANEYDVLNGGSGNDTFVIGESWGNFYQGFSYATIQDYNGAYDYIQLQGSASSFYLNKSINFGGGSGLDTAIYQDNGDLLAVVQDTTSIQLTSYYFNFV